MVNSKLEHIKPGTLRHLDSVYYCTRATYLRTVGYRGSKRRRKPSLNYYSICIICKDKIGVRKRTPAYKPTFKCSARQYRTNNAVEKTFCIIAELVQEHLLSNRIQVTIFFVKLCSIKNTGNVEGDFAIQWTLRRISIGTEEMY